MTDLMLFLLSLGAAGGLATYMTLDFTNNRKTISNDECRDFGFHKARFIQVRYPRIYFW